MTKLEINLFAGAAVLLAIAAAIAVHKPIITWLILALFTLHQMVSF